MSIYTLIGAVTCAQPLNLVKIACTSGVIEHIDVDILPRPSNVICFASGNGLVRSAGLTVLEKLWKASCHNDCIGVVKHALVANT